MAASDPSPYVATPTGTLQGVAAFSWDGSAWQPSGRAGPDVATPTGVLQGVAAFNGGPAWQPSGRAQPGVATPTGVLDGVAVYTWSGAAWTPPGGTETPSTPSGALRGVAAFNWDGAAWQPAAQARASVPTPYGVLDGVAMFGWTGSVWAAVGAPSLSLDFMTPGTLDPRITFTRASTATYFDATGTMQTAATNAPRWDYAAGILRGLLIEEARGNIWLQSADASNAAWVKLGTTSAAPVVTGNQTAAPDGTLTAASVVLPVVSAAGAQSLLYQIITLIAAPYVFSAYLKGAVGGEQLYIGCNTGATHNSVRVTLTTAWQRFALPLTGTAAGWVFDIGTDLTDGAQTSTPAGTVYVWGAQVEQGAFVTSYIPAGASLGTRAVDQCYVPTTGWFTSSSAYSLMVEFITAVATSVKCGIGDGVFGNSAYFTGDGFTSTQTGGGGASGSGLAASLGVVVKQCATYSTTLLKDCNNGTIVGTGVVSVAGQPTATRLSLGCSPWGLDNQVNGYVRRARHWPRVLADAEMQSVTT